MNTTLDIDRVCQKLDNGKPSLKVVSHCDMIDYQKEELDNAAEEHLREFGTLPIYDPERNTVKYSLRDDRDTDSDGSSAYAFDF